MAILTTQQCISETCSVSKSCALAGQSVKSMNFCRAMRCISAACRHAVSVRVSVTFVSCVKTNKDIFEFFFTIGQPHHYRFSTPNGWRYSDGNPPPP